jgi:hypothetical protein
MFEADLAVSTMSVVIDRLWLSESEKPEQARDWQSVLAILDKAKGAASLPGAIDLQVAETRARAIVYADHLGRRDEALALLDAVLPKTHTELQFLLHHTRACILFDAGRFLECIPSLENASSFVGNEFVHFSFSVNQLLAVAYGQTPVAGRHSCPGKGYSYCQ